MNSFKKTIYCTILSLLLFSNIALASEKSGNSPEFLYIQTAKYGELLYDNDAHSYKLILKGAYPFVSYFSSSPKKITGYLTTERFVHSFQPKEALNTGLVAFNRQTGAQLRYVISLKESAYDKKQQTIHYTLNILSPSFPHAQRIKLEDVALFIDACASCGGGGF